MWRNHPIFEREPEHEALHQAFRAIPGRCKKCGGETSTQRSYCVGVGAVRSDKEIAWMLQGGQLVAGCTRRGEHLHLKCQQCQYTWTMDTKDYKNQLLYELLEGTEPGTRSPRSKNG